MSAFVFPSWAGYVGIAVASLLFGSMFVPVKKFPSGDGVFFQWVLCSAIFMVGFIVNAVRGFPPFSPLSMVGGVLWCTGNLLAVPIIKMIGLSLGMLLWGISNELTGWFTATFGLFGLTAQATSIPVLNYIGAGLAVPAAIIFSFIRPTVEKPTSTDTLSGEEIGLINQEHNILAAGEKDWTQRLGPMQKRIFGAILSVISGILYGSNFTPPQYVMDTCHGCSQDGLDYVFSHFTGIFLTSTTFFIIYAATQKNEPRLHSRIVLPAFASGCMWAIAQCAWFVANSTLNMVITFPIITMMPGIIASVWGIVLFGEISGKRNYIVFFAALLVALTSTALVTLSKAL